MTSSQNLEQFKNTLETIYDLVDIHTNDTIHDDETWKNIGARSLIFLDQIILEAQLANTLAPKEYPPKRPCILAVIFKVLDLMSNVNEPFTDKTWLEYRRELNELPEDSNSEISYYELALTKVCSYITQLLGDKIQYLQKILIKQLFSPSKVGSIFASDVYMFLIRLMPPTHQTSLCGIVMNLCKLAPPESLTMGAALLNRAKHPVINFKNPNYDYILDFESN